MSEASPPAPQPQRIKLSPAQVFDLAVAQQSAGRLGEAAALYRAVRVLDPLALPPYLNLARVFSTQGRFVLAARVLEQALCLDPANDAALVALGIARHGGGDFQAATLWGKRVLALMPNNPDAANSLAHSLLCQGRLAEGWGHYLARPSTRIDPNPFDRRPLSADLRGRRLLVVGDQGLGDEIFFLRFVPRLKAAGAWVAYRAHPKIAGLVGRLPFLDHVSTRAAEDPVGIDTLLSVGDLPHLTAGFPDAAYPASIPLPPRPERLAGWRDRLAALGPPPYVGVIWRAGVADMLDKRVPVPALAATLRDVPGTVVALQRQPEAGEVEAFAQALDRPVADLGGLNEDLEEMLALLALLDELVGVSNTNLHLRAALGRNARVLVPFPAEFRWAGEGGGSPWFPGFAVYRQRPDAERAGGWGLALDQLDQQLRQDWPAGQARGKDTA